MKLPYREGDFIALPLGDGTLVRAQISACEHRLVLLTCAGRTLRASDDALAFHRWKRIEHGRPPRPTRAENGYWMHSARVEREFAAMLGVSVPKREETRALEVRDDAIPERVASGTTLTWSQPLRRLDSIAQLVAADATLGVRVQDDAVRQLANMASWKIATLTIAGPLTDLPLMPQVTDLTLLYPAPARSFPLLQRLRVVHRGEFDGSDVLTMPNLEHLELNGVALRRASRFLNCPSLHTLRLSRTTGLEKARHVALPQLRSLALENVGELTELSVLGEMPALEQLELHGFWQHDLGEMEWLLAMHRLKRVAVDVGGRRKNLELYRRADWAYPWPLSP